MCPGMESTVRIILLFLGSWLSSDCCSQACEIRFQPHALSVTVPAGESGSILCDATSCMDDLPSRNIERLSVVWKDSSGREVPRTSTRVFSMQYRFAPMTRLLVENAGKDIEGQYLCSVMRDGVVLQEQTIPLSVSEPSGGPKISSTSTPKFSPLGWRRGEQEDHKGQFVFHFGSLQSSQQHIGQSEAEVFAHQAAAESMSESHQNSVDRNESSLADPRLSQFDTSVTSREKSLDGEPWRARTRSPFINIMLHRMGTQTPREHATTSSEVWRNPFGPYEIEVGGIDSRVSGYNFKVNHQAAIIRHRRDAADETLTSSAETTAPMMSESTKGSSAEPTEAMAVNDTDSATIQETESTTMQETESTTMQETDSTTMQETESTTMQETESTLMEKTKSTARQDTKSTPIQETGSTSINETKSTTVQDTDNTTMLKTESTTMQGTHITTMQEKVSGETTQRTLIESSDKDISTQEYTTNVTESSNRTFVTLFVYIPKSASTNASEPKQRSTTISTSTTEEEKEGESTTNKDTGKCESCVTMDPGKRPVWPEHEDSFFGRHGVAAFAITLAVAILLLYALLLVIFLPKIMACCRGESAELTGTEDRKAIYKKRASGIEEAAPMNFQSDGNMPSGVIYIDEETALSGHSENKSFEGDKDDDNGPMPAVSTFLLRHDSQMENNNKNNRKPSLEKEDGRQKNGNGRQGDEGTVKAEEIELDLQLDPKADDKPAASSVIDSTAGPATDMSGGVEVGSSPGEEVARL